MLAEVVGRFRSSARVVSRSACITMILNLTLFSLATTQTVHPAIPLFWSYFRKLPAPFYHSLLLYLSNYHFSIPIAYAGRTGCRVRQCIAPDGRRDQELRRIQTMWANSLGGRRGDAERFETEPRMLTGEVWPDDSCYERRIQQTAEYNT